VGVIPAHPVPESYLKYTTPDALPRTSDSLSAIEEIVWNPQYIAVIKRAFCWHPKTHFNNTLPHISTYDSRLPRGPNEMLYVFLVSPNVLHVRPIPIVIT
jgi:hypothetical protein